MATPAKRPYQLSGADGRPITVHVYAAGAARPTVVIPSSAPQLAERFARAGLAVVALDSRADLDAVILALVGGELAGARAPWLAVDDTADEAAIQAALDWFASHLK
jgi:hypothetical protein